MPVREGNAVMAYSEQLAERVRDLLASEPELREQKMFGGIAFMLGGNVCCGVLKDELLVRVGPAAYEDALGEPRVREMDFTGRPMNGWVIVEAGGVTAETALASWVDRGRAFALTLPPKT
jgi:hypothetical protein